MENEAPARLDRPTVMDGAVRCLTWIDVKLLQQSAETDACSLVTHADADGAVLVVHAQGNHRPFEARIGHSGHREQELAGQECRVLGHRATMVRPSGASKTAERGWAQT
jgi:hypothetical protein